MLFCQMRLKPLERPPADKAFNRVAAEIPLNVAARLKNQWRLRSHQRQGIILASKRATISSSLAPRSPSRGTVPVPAQVEERAANSPSYRGEPRALFVPRTRLADFRPF